MLQEQMLEVSTVALTLDEVLKYVNIGNGMAMEMAIEVTDGCCTGHLDMWRNSVI